MIETKLRDYLLSHEDDIFNGINDFGDLRAIFFVMFGRPASDEQSKT